VTRRDVVGEPVAAVQEIMARIGPSAPDLDAPGFFDRADPSPDPGFYGPPRLVTHIDGGAIAAVGALYAELGIAGDVLDLMSSWISHFERPPRAMTGLGMNAAELEANPALSSRVVQDLNADPRLPFADASFDGAVCCVSVDYLVRPLQVFAEVARTLRPAAPFCVTFSNRCFPTKAIRGWLATDDAGRLAYVRRLFELTQGFGPPEDALRTDPGGRGDPLWGVWARRDLR
jgi:SAM-dependent methyltransferase